MRALFVTTALMLSLYPRAAQAQVPIAPKFLPGSTKNEMKLGFKQKLVIAGQTVDTVADIRMMTRVETTPRAADGTVRLATTTVGGTVHLELPGGMTVDFDTAKPDKKPDVPEIEAALSVFRALQGTTYTLVLNAKNEVTAVEGVDKILGSIPPELQDTLKKELSLEKLRRETAQTYGELPESPVKKGDRWQKSYVMDIGSGQKLTFDNFYEYQGTVEKDGRTLDKISFIAGAVTFSLDGELPGGLTVSSSDLKIDASGGTILYDREMGQVVDRSGTHKISGTMGFSVNGMNLPAMLDLTVDSLEKATK